MTSRRKIPRASFAITLLDDEDFHRLMSERGGCESFGAFVALCLVARHRLADKKAVQIEGTDAIRFTEGVRHVIGLAQVSRRQFDALIAHIEAIASETQGKPWLYVDGDGKLVIRSFFKWNTDTKHGGAREGSGRKLDSADGESRRNQVALDSKLEAPSDSDSDSVSVCVSNLIQLESSSSHSTHPHPPSAVRPPTRPDPLPTKPPEPPEPPVPTDSTPPRPGPSARSPAPPRRDMGPDADDPDPLPPVGPIDPRPVPKPPINDPADVQRLVDLAEEIEPLGSLAGWVRAWCADHPWRFVQECLLKARHKRQPSSYIGALLRAGPDPVAASRPRPADRPEPPRLEHRIHRAPRQPTSTTP